MAPTQAHAELGVVIDAHENSLRPLPRFDVVAAVEGHRGQGIGGGGPDDLVIERLSPAQALDGLLLGPRQVRGEQGQEGPGAENPGLLPGRQPVDGLRATVLPLRRRADIRAAVGFGASTGQVLRTHVLPDIGLVLIAGLVSAVERAIAIEAGLAFLGLVNPIRASWGSIMRDALDFRGLFLTDSWRWWLLPPVAAVALLLVGLALVGTSLERRLDPRLSRHQPVGVDG